MEVPQQFISRYEHLASLYQSDNYQLAATEAHSLLRDLMIATYVDAKRSVTKKSVQASFARAERRILGARDIFGAQLYEIAQIFDATKILDVTKHQAALYPILKTRNFKAVAELSIQSINSSSTHPVDMLKRMVLDIFMSITLFLSLAGWRRSEIIVNHNSSGSHVPKTFDLDLETGIMVNPFDHSRNVSFKAITFGLMLGNICSELLGRFHEIANTISPTVDGYDSIQASLTKAGVNAGAKFGRALLELPLKPSASMADRIDLWCKFDTNVGWGRFENVLHLPSDPQRLTGKIVLHNNFLATEVGTNAINICGLMTGYISGVLSSLLGIQVQVVHDVRSGHCAKGNSTKNYCEFLVSAAI